MPVDLFEQQGVLSGGVTGELREPVDLFAQQDIPTPQVTPWASPEAAAQRRAELGENIARYGELALRGAAELPLGVAQTVLERVPGETAENVRQSIARVTAETERQAEEAGLSGQLARAIPQIGQLAPAAAGGVLGGALTGAAVAGAQPVAEGDLEQAIQQREQQALTGGALGAGLGAVAKLAPYVSKGLSTLRDKLISINPQAARDFAEENITPTLAVISDSGFVKLVDRGLSKFPGAIGIMERNARNTLEGMKRSLDKYGRIKAVTPEEAGRVIEAGARNYVQKFKNISGKLYNKLDDVIPANKAFNVQNSRDLFERSTKAFSQEPALQARLQSGEGFKILSSIAEDAKNGTLRYEAIKRYRTLIGDKLGNPQLLAGEDQALLKQAYAALSDDLAQAAIQQGDKAVRAFERANNFYRAGAEQIEGTLQKLINKDTPEQIFQAATQGTRLGGTKIRNILKTLNPQEKEVVRGTVLNRLGLANPSKQNALGNEFSPATFLTNWNRTLSPEAKDALFGTSVKKMRKDLDRIARMNERIKDIDRFGNPSGTGAINALNALFLGSFLQLPAVLGGVAGANASARLMTNPKFISWLSKASTQRAVTRQNMANNMKQLERLAKDNPDMAQDIAKYVTLLGAISIGK